MQASLFDASRALDIVRTLQVEGMPPGECHKLRALYHTASVLQALCIVGLAPSERLHLISGMVSLTSPQQLGALGALLSILQEVQRHSHS